MKQELSCIVIASLVGTASADVILLDFEGLGQAEQINDFYNGGSGSDGSVGPDLGVAFSDITYALIDADAGGGGNFANAPSGITVMMFFLFDDYAAINVAAGFDTGFGIDFSSIGGTGEIEVYSGLDGTGDMLGSLALPELGSSGNGDPTGLYDTWDRAMIEFSGIAKSVVFSFSAGSGTILFDDATFGSTTVSVVPLPPAALAGLGLLGGMGVVRRLRK